MSLYGVIGYHVTLSEPITPYTETLVPHLVATLIYLSQIYSYYIMGDMSPLRCYIIFLFMLALILFTPFKYLADCYC